jgi:hypothetical protein
LFPGLNFCRVQNIGVLFLSSQVFDQLSSHLEIGGLLAAGVIILKQIVAMEVAHTSYVLEQQ